MDGFILTSDHVIPSFQGTERPPAESWTGLLKEETPEVSEGQRGTAEPHSHSSQQSPEGLPHTVPAGPHCAP